MGLFPMKHDELFMAEAILEAEKAYELGEVPIGAIITYKDEIIGRGYNLRETTQNAVTHAEIQAIQQACEMIGSWRLEDTTLYVTLEPCPMCAGAILQSRIPRVVYGARDSKGGAVHSLYGLLSDSRMNHECTITEGILGEQCGQLLSTFFRALRNKKKALKKISSEQNDN